MVQVWSRKFDVLLVINDCQEFPWQGRKANTGDYMSFCAGWMKEEIYKSEILRLNKLFCHLRSYYRTMKGNNEGCFGLMLDLHEGWEDMHKQSATETQVCVFSCSPVTSQTLRRPWNDMRLSFRNFCRNWTNIQAVDLTSRVWSETVHMLKVLPFEQGANIYFPLLWKCWN